MSAASPGVIAVFLANQHYPTREAYLDALADAMSTEYEAIHRAGSAPGRLSRPRDEPAHPVRRPDDVRVPQAGRDADRGAEPRARQHPRRCGRLHLCWGNYEGPHHRDIAMNEIADMVLKAKPAGHFVRGIESPPRARVAKSGRTSSCPRTRCSYPVCSIHRRTSSSIPSGGGAHRAIRECGRTRECDRGNRLRFLDLRGIHRSRTEDHMGKAEDDGGRRADRIARAMEEDHPYGARAKERARRIAKPANRRQAESDELP